MRVKCVEKSFERSGKAGQVDENAYASLLGSIAEAGVHPNKWDGVLEDLSAFSGSRGVGIIPLGGNKPGLRCTPSLDDMMYVYVADGWSTRDLRYACVPKMLQGHIGVDSDFIDHDGMRKEPYYDSYLRSLGYRHFAGMLVRSGDETWAVTLQRRVDDDAFSVEEQRALAPLVKPLNDAVTMNRLLAESYHRGSLDGLDSTGKACIMVDRMGRAAHLSKAAEAMVGSLFDLRRGALWLGTHEATQRLHAALRMALMPPLAARSAAVSPTAGSTVASGPPTIVVTRSGARFAFEIIRLPELDISSFARFGCMILVHVLTSTVAVDVGTLRAVFGLTAREAALAAALPATFSLVEAARELGITYETARSQLKSVFAKTATGSQAELIGLLSNLANAVYKGERAS